LENEEYLVRHGLRDGGQPPWRGPLAHVRGIAHELSVLRLFGLADWARLFGDILLFRVMRFARLPREDAPRTVNMRDGTVLTYRLNRGDIQVLREIWLDEVYMPPPEAAGLQTVVDLGANIGFTSVYLFRRLNARHVTAVEPDPANVRILERNLRQNDVCATVISAAVGPVDGLATFRRDRASNRGRLETDGDLNVSVISMNQLLNHVPQPDSRVFLKVDIEGGEEQLFTGDLSWLGRFDCLMAELHPEVADMRRITTLIEQAGLSFRLGGGRGQPPSCWVRREPASRTSRTD
jgi:FkbM family methyltransferase